MFSFLGILLGLLIAVVVMVGISRLMGFHTQKPADFAKGPAFDMRQHLNGPILCEGVIYGPLGRVSSRFVANMLGTWNGNTGTLAETFRYDTGVVQERCWTLRVDDAGTIMADAADLVGTGTGTQHGPAVQMRYRIKLDDAAGGHELNVIDWMYLMENGTIMNRSQFRKFGLPVAELIATLRKVAA
jgi:hypothetical protein